MDFGVYIHFPWCRARCPYCDFAIAVAPLEQIPHAGYADAVLAELRARAPLYEGRTLRSIYFGGGTPALWNPSEIARVRAGVLDLFGAAALAEVTVEANPNDCRPSVLDALCDAGVDRLSIGAQGFSDDDLVFLGRDHGGRAAAAAFGVARAAGFERVSLDLIYALPGRSLEAWRRTLDEASALSPDHLSVYQLTIEAGTPFGAAQRAGRLIPTDDDRSAEQFEEAHLLLQAAGYEHYEVSSYARPGRRAVHNSLYWSGAEYLGLGNGASSFWQELESERGLRWSSHRSVVKYLAATPTTDPRTCAAVAETVPLDAGDLRDDRLWTGLRTSDGVPREWAAGRAGLPRLFAAGLVEDDGTRLRPTARGLLFADEIAQTLLE